MNFSTKKIIIRQPKLKLGKNNKRKSAATYKLNLDNAENIWFQKLLVFIYLFFNAKLAAKERETDGEGMM